MENKKHSQQFLRKRKFLLVLPFLVLPFITMFFWALGGGKGNNVEAQSISKQTGLNLKLPDAKLKSDKGFDKLSFYKQAALDSQKIFKERKLDPYWNKYSLSNKTDEDPFHLSESKLNSNHHINEGLPTLLNSNKHIGDKEAKIYSKIQQLKAQLNKASQKSKAINFDNTNNLQVSQHSYSTSKDINRLEEMMQAMKQNAGEDVEVKQLDNVLNKILAIQHPESINDTIAKASQLPGNTYKVSVKEDWVNVSLLKSNQLSNFNDTILPATLVEEHSSFYSLNDAAFDITDHANIIRAIVPETQTIVTGSTIKLLLSSTVIVKGLTIREGTYIYGKASLTNERLKINVTSIQYEGNILPVSLEVYDLDGIAGIYVPGSISSDVAKQSTDQAVGSIGLTTVDPSLAAQATSAGIQAAKTLIGKKVKLVKVTITAGYQILLKDNTRKQ